MGGLELDERRHQRLHRKRPRRVAERQGPRLRRGQAAGFHVSDVQRAREEQRCRVRRAGRKTGALYETHQRHRQQRLRDGAKDPRGLLRRLAADAKGAESLPVETINGGIFSGTSLQVTTKRIDLLH